MARIGYLGSTKPLDGDRALLKEWGYDDVELFDVPAEPGGAPDPGSLDGADALIIEWGKADAATIAAYPQLKVVSLMSIGYDNADVEAATKAGVWVTNIPGYCTYDVALHSLGLVVDLYKRITFLDRQVQAGVWDEMQGYEPPRPQGQQAGLVFFGSIAQALVPMLKGIGMEVAVWAPTKSAEFLRGFGVTKVETIDELFATSDVVSLHCPLLPVTQDLVCRRTLELMKPTAFLVNTARGGCVNEEDLAAALKAGTIRAAAVDVIKDEAGCRSPLIGLENCIVTSHGAYHSSDSFQEMRERALRNALAAVVGERPATPVNEVG